MTWTVHVNLGRQTFAHISGYKLKFEKRASLCYRTFQQPIQCRSTITRYKYYMAKPRGGYAIDTHGKRAIASHYNSGFKRNFTILTPLCYR